MTSAVGADEELDGVYEVISGHVSLYEAVQRTPVENLFVVGSNINLTGANVELVDEERKEYFLKDKLEKVETRMGLHFHRLSAISRGVDAQWSGCSRLCGHSAAVRVFCT